MPSHFPNNLMKWVQRFCAKAIVGIIMIKYCQGQYAPCRGDRALPLPRCSVRRFLCLRPTLVSQPSYPSAIAFLLLPSPHYLNPAVRIGNRECTTQKNSNPTKNIQQ